MITNTKLDEMKTKIFAVIFSAIVLSVLNLSLQTSDKEPGYFLEMLSNKAFADGEIPEIVITCSDSNYGYCFVWGIEWCNYDDLFGYRCWWTGSPNDYCSIILTKLCNFLIGNL